MTDPTDPIDAGDTDAGEIDAGEISADRDAERHDPPRFRGRAGRRRYVRPIVFVLVVVPLVLAALAVGAAIAIRLQGDDPAEWHLDPLTAPTPSSPNSYRVAPAGAEIDRNADAPVFAVPVSELAAAFDAVALGDDRVEVLAGSAADGFVTYVQRSALFAFPDYVSVRFVDVGAGSSLAVFSRSRYGKSDLGVNEKRVTRWLDQLEQAVG
jgi:uncharacterized protein (DUF1499 family)